MPALTHIPAGVYRLGRVSGSICYGVFFLNSDTSFTSLSLLSEANSPWHPSNQDYVFSTILNHGSPQPTGYWAMSATPSDWPVFELLEPAANFLVQTSNTSAFGLILQKSDGSGGFDDYIDAGALFGNGTPQLGLPWDVVDIPNDQPDTFKGVNLDNVLLRAGATSFGDLLLGSPQSAVFISNRPSGDGTITGTVDIDGVLGIAQVRVYTQDSGVLIDQTTSDVDGNYVFTGLSRSHKYRTAAHDLNGVHKSDITDNLTPE